MYDVIVIGLGAMGSSACLHLARRGRRVLGLEQFEIGHGRGSSHGLSRMIRMCYYEHPDYVPLLRRSYELWRELEAASGGRLLHITGGVYMGRGDGEFMAGSRRAAVEHGLAHEVLTREDLRRGFPQFTVPEDFSGFWEPTAGYVLPEAAVATQAELALRAGADLRGHEGVVSWRAEGKGVEVVTERGQYSAARLIVCGGAWAARLLGETLAGSGGLRVTRQVLGWLWPRRPELFEAGRLPVWAIDATGETPGGLYYGFPMQPEAPGVKVARHVPGETADPDGRWRDAKSADEQDFRPGVHRFIPDADGALLGVRACLYTNSPDGHFIIDRSPRHPAVVVACGFSGHGFKFAPVVGEILADLAEHGATALPAGFLSLDRFRS